MIINNKFVIGSFRNQQSNHEWWFIRWTFKS